MGNEVGQMMLVRKSTYIASLKALYVFLEQLTDAYIMAKESAHSNVALLEMIEDQIQIVSQIAEALSASASPPDSDPNTSN